jgi:hypothetical protein
MAEEVTAGAPEGEQTGEKDIKNQKVPYERFEEVNTRARKAEEELASIRDKLIALEDRDKSETERERAARERAEAKAEELFAQVTGLQKGSWVRSAALEVGFHDPEDAVTYLSGKLAGIEDEREAKKLVKRLAEDKKHLVRQEEKKERPTLSRVFGEGQQQQGQQQQAPTPAQAAQQAELEFAKGLGDQLKKFLPENSDNWYEAGRIDGT